LIRPIANSRGKAERGSKGAFVRNAALAAALAAPLNGSFAETERGGDSAGVGDSRSTEAEGFGDAEDERLSYDWTKVAAASFRRLLMKDPGLRIRRSTGHDDDDSGSSAPSSSFADPATATVSFDDVAAVACAWDDSEALCRATLREEFDRADKDKDGRLGIMEWTDLVWSEGLMDGSGRVRSACGADAPAPDPAGPRVLGVGNPGCDLMDEAAVKRPPTELTARERARANAAARKKMASQRVRAKVGKQTDVPSDS
jgi:hypothetical protein